MAKRQASKFYPFFDVKERPTIDYLVGLFNNLIFKHRPILTDFLDPGERQILKTIVGKEAYVFSYGGFKNAEKKRAFLSDKPLALQVDDFKIAAFALTYPRKFTSLNHSAILGTLANSGVETNTFGDIITDGQGRWQFLAKAELSSFFTGQINRIGATKVKVQQIPLVKVLQPADDSTKEMAVVGSLRIDAVLAGITRKSRSQIKKALTANEVKLNWQNITNSNIMVQENDVISLRHFGRVKLVQMTRTKKGKYRVVFKLWRTRKKR